ncbi:MAG: TonB-dependent receptor, partial [Chloroflexi bacterium]|nr:TonB-dependent receptor [Chloroflexota bacterium]
MLGQTWNSHRKLWMLGLLLVLWAFGPTASAAAQGSAGGAVIGTIADAQGGVLPGVTLTLRNVDSGVLRSGVTDGSGLYRLPGLPPGRYDLTAELPGFASIEVPGLTINIGLELRRDLTMALEGLAETVTVTGEAPMIEATQTEVASIITQEQIAMLPIADRQPISLSLLLPGTSMDSTSVRRSQPNIGAGGAGNTMNIYHVDGGMNMSNNSGQQHLEVPQGAIQEFKVNVSQATAEYGAIGGVVLTATKSGTNLFSGEAFEYFRDKSLNAFNQIQLQRHDDFGDPKPDYRRNTYGMALGGPIIQDRLHFFVAAERSKRETSFTVNTGAPEFYGSLEGNFPSLYERRAFFGRADLQINPQQNLFIRYTYDMEIIDCEGCGGSTSATAGVIVRSPRDSNLIGHTWVIGNRMLNEFRSQIPPSHLNHRQGPAGLELYTGPPGQFSAERFANFKDVFVFPSTVWGNNGWSVVWTDRFEIRDDFSLPVGDHNLKVGGAFVNLHSPEEQSTNRGRWVFDEDQFFDGSAAAMANLTNPIQFTASFPPGLRDMRNHWIQGYVQDEWRVRDNLTVNLGLRYDNQYRAFNQHLDFTGRERLRELINPDSRGDNNNFGPRAGFAWDVTDDGRRVVRGAYGVYYQYVMQGGMRPEMVALLQNTVNISNPGYPDPYGGLTPDAFVAASSRPNVRIMDDDLRNGTATDYSVGYSHELAPSLALHVDGVYADVQDLTEEARTNTPLNGVSPFSTWG